MLIDTHCHLNYPPLSDDIDAVIARATAAGVTHLINIGTQPENFAQTLATAAAYPQVSAAIGLHPEHAEHFDDNYCRLFESLMHQADAIGETGLDYFHEKDPDARARQQASFVYHLQHAGALGKTTVVHCRDAVADTAALIKKHARDTIVIHCFTGDVKDAAIFLDLGCYLSFSGILTFKSAVQLHEAAHYVPADRILVETDAPFLAPMPHRGKPCEPAFVRFTAERAAQLRGMAFEAFAALSSDNARVAFKL